MEFVKLQGCCRRGSGVRGFLKASLACQRNNLLSAISAEWRVAQAMRFLPYHDVLVYHLGVTQREEKAMLLAEGQQWHCQGDSELSRRQWVSMDTPQEPRMQWQTLHYTF